MYTLMEDTEHLEDLIQRLQESRIRLENAIWKIEQNKIEVKDED